LAARRIGGTCLEATEKGSQVRYALVLPIMGKGCDARTLAEAGATWWTEHVTRIAGGSVRVD
jgi:hypothetical protein